MHKSLKLFSMKKLLINVAFLASFFSLKAQQITLEKNWKFTRNDHKNFSEISINDKKWQSVTIPHDWAIYGPFHIENDVQRTAIKQDGQKDAIEHSGRTGGLPFVGVGWYRRNLDVPNFSKDKKVFLKFDGAMSNAEIFINGKKAGQWHNGYNTFIVDATDFVSEKNNVLAVRLENLTQQSRWYPGAGLYRNVHLIVKNKTHIPVWGVQITTPEIKKEFAKIVVKTQIEGVVKEGKNYLIKTEIKDKNGEIVAKNQESLSPFGMDNIDNVITQQFVIRNPKLWDIQQPNLYTAHSKLLVIEGEQVATLDFVKDEISTSFGIRKIEIKPNDGFYLNDRKIKFQGACMHHDLGALGAAVNEAAIRRQIKMLQDMGVNAIRTSHNMPAPEYVRIADEMGMMLAVESFDEWAIPKVENGYNRYFKDWAEKDLTNLVKHFRNNPSVVMWFIGNEVEEQSHPEGAKVAYNLQRIIKNLDSTRPISNGMDRPDHIFSNNMGATIEVAGFNYRPFKYQEAYKKLPQQIILGSETASTISSRGVYKFPVKRKSMPKYADQQTSSYDVEHCGWSNLPEDDWIHHEDLPYTIGEFIWTGFDYLGEPTPYYSEWPSHSSYFGAVDLAGIPKDRFYLYRSHWNKNEETLHILPHWNWEGREGEVTPIFVYTNYPSAEVFINGKSQGKRTKDFSISLNETENKEAQQSFERQKRYRLMWNETKYEPGEVKVIAYDQNGKTVAEKIIKTAAEPYALRLTADRQTILADGKDLSFITVEAVDKDGNFCPLAQNSVEFKVNGEGKFRAVANGDATSLEQFHLPKMKLFNGKLVAIVQASEKEGELVFTAKSKGLQSATLRINSQKNE